MENKTRFECRMLYRDVPDTMIKLVVSWQPARPEAGSSTFDSGRRARMSCLPACGHSIMGFAPANGKSEERTEPAALTGYPRQPP